MKGFERMKEMKIETTKYTKYTKKNARMRKCISCTSCISWFKNILPLAIVGFAFAVNAATGMSEEFRIDLSGMGPWEMRTARASEAIRYSTAWVDGAAADATAVVDVNGVMLSSVAGSGAVTWTPERNGTYTLTHKVMSGDEQVGETLTATFVVEGLNPEEPVISPDSGTTFEGSLTVSMSCPTDGATIHYTTNGVEPTAESPVYKRFRIYGKTTVKAVAEKNGMLSEVVTAEYALGQCADPVISLADGASFAHSNQVVSIAWNNDGILRYTLDGTDPTPESPVYEAPFSVNESVVVKAKVFSEAFFDSAVVVANLVRSWERVSTPVIDAAATFRGSKTKVAIACATEGAVVRYTLNGSVPDVNSAIYTEPFYVTGSCVIKAYASKEDYLDSAMASQTVEKVWGIGDTMGNPDQEFSTAGSNGLGWTRVVDATAPNGEAMRSGAIAHGQTSTLSTTVTGPGTLTFSWRTSCEEDELHEWDHAEFAVDGVVRLVLDGVTGWRNEAVAIAEDGVHTIEWRYVKDDMESEGEDAAWVAGFGWTPKQGETQTTDVHVPYAWIKDWYPEIVDGYDAFESAAKATAANGRDKVWECYVAGISPVDPAAKFTAKIEMKDGCPIVTWEPDLNAGGEAIRVYKVYGSETLVNGGNWQYPTNSLHRFFKVKVEMP